MEAQVIPSVPRHDRHMRMRMQLRGGVHAHGHARWEAFQCDAMVLPAPVYAGAAHCRG